MTTEEQIKVREDGEAIVLADLPLHKAVLTEMKGQGWTIYSLNFKTNDEGEKIGVSRLTYSHPDADKKIYLDSTTSGDWNFKIEDLRTRGIWGAKEISATDLLLKARKIITDASAKERREERLEKEAQRQAVLRKENAEIRKAIEKEIGESLGIKLNIEIRGHNGEHGFRAFTYWNATDDDGGYNASTVHMELTRQYNGGDGSKDYEWQFSSYNTKIEGGFEAVVEFKDLLDKAKTVLDAIQARIGEIKPVQ